MIFALDAVKVFIQKVVRENSVQIAPNFPAKSLSVYTKYFSWHIFCYLWLKRILNMKLCWFIKYIIENNKKDNNWTLYFIDLLTNSTCNIRRQQVNKYWSLLAKLSTFALVKKKKKTAHAYFRHRIFSKSFGGKIRHIWTDVTYRVK